MTVNNKFYFPIGKEIGGRATNATPGGSLRERLAAARQKAVDIPEKPFDYENHLSDVVKGLNDAGVSPMNVPAEKRRESYLLESQIHNAAMEKRQADFIGLVNRWKNIFDGGQKKC